jgi:hypothetical protein
MKIYLLYHSNKGLHLAMGKDCVSAAKALSEKTGLSNVDEWSVSGSWDAQEGSTINVGAFWPFFTNSPCESFTKK